MGPDTVSEQVTAPPADEVTGAGAPAADVKLEGGATEAVSAHVPGSSGPFLSCVLPVGQLTGILGSGLTSFVSVPWEW